MPTPQRRAVRPRQARLMHAPLEDHAYNVAQVRHILERQKRLEAVAEAARVFVRTDSAEARVQLARALATLDTGGM